MPRTVQAHAQVTTASEEEVARFQAIADAWWDSQGSFKPLHQINRPRLEALTEHLVAHFGRDRTASRPFEGLTLIDIGCGGGLLCEPMARLGFTVTGIDAGARNVEVAKLHAQQSGLSIDYRAATPEQVEGQFDVVLSMEVIEHVPDTGAFLAACADRLKPGGAFCGATLNRTGKSFALAIVGAEYVLRWLPRGTHDWKKFLKPSEVVRGLRGGAIEAQEIVGVVYSPLSRAWSLNKADLDVNYMLYGTKAP